MDENSVNDAAWSQAGAYAAIFADGGATEITRNTVEMQAGAIGIQLQSASPAVQRLIANNFVNARGNTFTDAGIVLTTGSVDVVHNTVRVASTLPDAAALRVNTGTIPDVHLRNNLFVNDGGGYALEVPGVGDVETSDYNDLYTTGAVLVEWEGVDQADLEEYQDASGLDAHSVSEFVDFVDIAGTGDLHLDSFSEDDPRLIGDPFASITEDADGDARDPFNPKMGADEGVSIPPLDNADDPGPCYTIGGAGPDYFNLFSAVDDLNRLGTKGLVTFCIRPGFQVGGLTIESFDRATDDPVTFRADDPSNPPTIAFTGAAVLTLDGADHLAFENLILGPSANAAGDSRVLAACRPDGLVTGFVVGVASTQQRWLAESLLALRAGRLTGVETAGGFAGTYLADKGFEGEDRCARWSEELGADVITNAAPHRAQGVVEEGGGVVAGAPSGDRDGVRAVAHALLAGARAAARARWTAGARGGGGGVAQRDGAAQPSSGQAGPGLPRPLRSLRRSHTKR